jgi:hypothetical protein
MLHVPPAYDPERHTSTVSWTSVLPLNQLNDTEARFGSVGEEIHLHVVPRAQWEQMGRPAWLLVEMRGVPA